MTLKLKFRYILFVFPFLGLLLLVMSSFGIFRYNLRIVDEDYYEEVLNSTMVNCSQPKSITELNSYADLAAAFQIRQNENEMWNNNFTSDEYPLLEEFFNKVEKTKIIMIFTTWRSGSTFLGEVLQSHPAMYYHFEPLMYLQGTQVNNETLEKETLPLIENLLNCNYTATHNLSIFNEFNQTQFWIHYHNPRLWQYCSCDYSLCRNSPFLERLCGTFPFQTMKLVRLRLKNAERFINDPRNDIKVVHLVRDPRAIWVSRQIHPWCRSSPDCWDPKRLCQDMVNDYYSFQYLKEIYPDKIFKVMFEDLSLNPELEIKTLMKDLGLSYHPFMQEFIRTHTKESKADGTPFDTFRKSTSVAFAWLNYFEGNEAQFESITTDCKEALELWGYQ